MKLYHYTEDIESILENGILRSYRSESTDIINEVILDVKGELPIDRDYCVYLSFDARDELRFTIEIDVLKLNTELMYVADETFADEIYDKYYYADIYGDSVNKYCKSIMRYNEYINSNIKYAKPEIIYLDDVGIEAIINYTDNNNNIL